MSRNSSLVGSAGGMGGSVMSVVASAGGAFHGHTIESWDVERHIESLREEVKESLDESRRSKLYCQQVKKQLEALVDTDLDARQDHEMLGGIALLLSNTNTLVEKFAAFEQYLREKIAAEQEARDARLLHEAQESARGAIDALRDDVRETLKSFKKEILGLRQDQQERYATCDDAIRVLRGDMESSVSASSRTVQSKLTSHIEQRFADAEKFTTKELIVLRQEQHERLAKFDDAMRDVRSEIEGSVAVLRQEQHERLTKFNDTVRDLRSEIESSVSSASRSIQSTLTSKIDQRFSDAEKNAGSGIANMQSVLTALEQRAMESVASLKKFVNASLSDLRIALDEATADVVRSRQLASHVDASEAAITDLRRSLAMHMKALADGAEKHARDTDSIQQSISEAVQGVRSVAEARIATVEARTQDLHCAVQDRLHVLETESVASVCTNLEALDRRVSMELANREASLRADLQGMQDVFITVFGPHCLTATTGASAASAARSNNVVGTLEASLDRQKRQILEELLQTHLKTIHDATAAHNASTIQLRRQVFHQAAMWLKATVLGRHRNDAFQRWMAFARWRQDVRQRVRAAQRQKAVLTMQRSMVPQLGNALRRVTFGAWKRFLVQRRNSKRIGRIAQNLCISAARRIMRRYLASWVRLVHRVRRPARLSSRLKVQSDLSLGRRWFGRWCRSAVAHQKRRRLQRDAHLLALASGTAASSWSVLSTSTPPQVSAIRHSSQSTQFIQASREVRGGPSYYLRMELAPRDAMLLRHILQMWVAHCWRRRYVHLRHTIVATDALVEAARNDVRCVVGDIGALRDAQTTFQQRVAAIVLHNTSGVEASRATKGSGAAASPGKGLANTIQLLHDGYASIHDVFRCLSLWVDVVDRTQRGLVRDVANLQAWSAAVEEEIRRVQTYVRPPFK